MPTLSMETEQLKGLIEEKIQDVYIEKYINKPVIDEEKIFILSTILNNTMMPTNKKRQYIITTMLVQIALDTHDLVPITSNVNESKASRTSKQLSVLAGDYYSGLYYLLLSEIEDFDMIHALASAIKEINEYKMKLYYKEYNSLEEYVNLVEKIESLLITRVAEHVNKPIMNYVVEKWLITIKLIEDTRKIHNGSYLPIFDHWLKGSTTSTYSSMIKSLENIIQRNINQIEESLLHLPLQLIVFKTHIHNTLNESMYNNTSMVEEG